jgi:hypothetical protein
MGIILFIGLAFLITVGLFRFVISCFQNGLFNTVASVLVAAFKIVLFIVVFLAVAGGLIYLVWPR